MFNVRRAVSESQLGLVHGQYLVQLRRPGPQELHLGLAQQPTALVRILQEEVLDEEPESFAEGVEPWGLGDPVEGFQARLVVYIQHHAQQSLAHEADRALVQFRELDYL